MPTTEEEVQDQDQEKKQPAHRFRIGMVEAALWQNITQQDRVFYSVTFSRSYRDGDEWKKSDSFPHDDLLNLAKIAERAEIWIARQQRG